MMISQAHCSKLTAITTTATPTQTPTATSPSKGGVCVGLPVLCSNPGFDSAVIPA